MKLPVSWLREFVDVAVEPRRLGEDLTMAGLALEGLETDGKDAVLDLDVTTNRVDAMNVYGLAREVSVIYGLPLRPLDLSFRQKGTPVATGVFDVTIEAADLCPRFCGRVLDVRMGPSPAWLRDRLEQMGVRPISNVVDLTNYVMLEMGQPSHAFDLARVPQGRLNVRWAREGERLKTLDGVERALHPRVGVVGGVDGPLALAGIMGGATSEVSDETRTVALEAAYWEPLAIRRAARSLAMHTEASHRFERGADPEGTVVATARIAHLLEKIGAGSARPGLVDRVASPRPRRSVSLRPSRLRAVLGVDVPGARSEAILKGLGFGVAVGDAGALRLEVPTWRSDVAREDDAVEEVGRHYGLHEIPSALPPSATVGGLRPAQAEERAVREILVGAGCSEVINYAFEAATGREAVALANPLAEDQSVLRTSLMPGLLRALDENLRHGRKDVAIFEIGRVFKPTTSRPREERHLGILLAGSELSRHWTEKARSFDFYDLKGILELLLERLGRGPLELSRANDVPAFLHPGQTAQILRDGKAVGFLGALRPDSRPGGAAGGALAEVDLEFGSAAALRDRFRPLPRFPGVDRDLSIVVDAATEAAEVERRIRASAGPALVGVTVTDRYEGSQVPAGKVSLLLSLRYEDRERTLTGEEVQASLDEVIRELRAAGFDIRGE
jgi:phenylalanyl-tRNA synthetase beta chain